MRLKAEVVRPARRLVTEEFHEFGLVVDGGEVLREESNRELPHLHGLGCSIDVSGDHHPATKEGFCFRVHFGFLVAGQSVPAGRDRHAVLASNHLPA